MIVMKIVMYELFKSFPVQEVDFKWSSGSTVNNRIWFLTEQADELVKLENHRALDFLVLLINEFQKPSPVNTAKKKTSSSVNPCTTDVWRMRTVQKEDPMLILLLCSSITHLGALLETNHCSRWVCDKNCFSTLTLTASLQAVRPFYSILDFLCCLSGKIIWTMMEKHIQNAQQEQVEGRKASGAWA